MGRPIIVSTIPENKVELPYHECAADPRDVQKAIVHVQAMSMTIPSIHAVLVRPAIRTYNLSRQGEFVPLSVDDFMDIFENARPYIVRPEIKDEDYATVPRMLICLRDEWKGVNEIHMFRPADITMSLTIMGTHEP